MTLAVPPRPVYGARLSTKIDVASGRLAQAPGFGDHRPAERQRAAQREGLELRILGAGGLRSGGDYEESTKQRGQRMRYSLELWVYWASISGSGKDAT